MKPSLKIFNECRSLTGMGEVNPHWRSSMNVKFNGGGTLVFPNTFVDLPNGMLNWEWGPSTLQAQALRVYIHLHMHTHIYIHIRSRLLSLYPLIRVPWFLATLNTRTLPSSCPTFLPSQKMPSANYQSNPVWFYLLCCYTRYVGTKHCHSLHIICKL